MEAKVTQTALNSLITVLKDGQKGYADAMVDVKDQHLKELFKKYSAQRASYVTELENQMFKLDLKPDTDEGSSVAGAIHHAWIDLKAAVTGHDNHAILAECERGEDVAKKAYEEASKVQNLPSELKSIIDKQAQGVKAAHDEIRGLRDSSK
ncbi:PA2169 family four-helix-bundle protein [Hymenobacter ginsengisoli]|uniref:PA2169 family four-helix-bundle protein n=1 Tax=Hymenobacter ginsengisoli TaxID=1051626 RepID=A0ABP8QMX3_9BACT|nr:MULTISPECIES: PA2169 family four-helix-bundle protein [unclassified Hymenobacter]MBO2031140.1 PA2169 family four-helix-bundle protein [Hymenobacter sp. BT559]